MSTFGQITRGAVGVLGDSGINGSVAVAAAALVVVLTIVVVFVMVLRSNGSASKTAHGLGYDAQRGPMGQPQNDPNAAWGGRSSTPADAAPWGANAAANGWGGASDPGANGGQGGQFGPMGGAQRSAAPGGWNVGGTASANGWDAPAAAQQDASPWGAPQRASAPGWDAPASPPSRPAAAAWDAPAAAPASTPAAGGWGAPASTPAAAAGWGAPANDPAPWDAGAPASAPWDAGAPASAPWDAGAPASAPWDAGAPASAPQWSGQPAAAAPASMPAAGGWGSQPDAGAMPAAGGWGAPAASPAPRQGPPSTPMAGGYAGNGYAAAPAPAYGDASAPAYGDAPAYSDDRTRVARQGGPQRLGVIVVRQGKEPGRIFEIRRERMTIGRSRDSDIFLEDLAVSRLHTTVGRDEAGNYMIRDEASANGTYVNNQRITEQPLEEGDEIQVGQTVLAFMRQ